MDRLITYKSREWITDDEVLYSDCKVKPGVDIPVKAGMKLMIVFHVEDQELEYYHEHYTPEEIHHMFEEDPHMVLRAFENAGGNLNLWRSLSHEVQVYNTMLCYDVCTDTFDMSEFDPSEIVD